MTVEKDKYRLLCTEEESIPVFSRDWWLDIVCGENKWDVLLHEQKGQTIAAMPLYVPHAGIISMPPYTQTMGPWFKPQANDTKYTTTLNSRQTICNTFIERIQKYPHFLQNFSVQITDWLPFYWKGYKQTTRYTYILHEINNSIALWENMSANIRRNITKAKDKHHITIKQGIPIDDFLKMQRQTFDRQQMHPENPNVLKRLIEECKKRKQGEIWGGYDEKGQLHAAAFIVWQKSSAYYLAGGGDPCLRTSGAHSLVMWTAIQYISQYTNRFDFEGSMLPGVERFFREFGAIQTPFFTITKGNLSLIYRAWLKFTRLIKR